MHEDALSRALANAEGLVRSARTAAAARPTGPLAPAGGSWGVPVPSLGRAREQAEHCRGWVYAAVRAIASRIAGQPICAGRKVRSPARGPSRKADVPLCVKSAGNVEPLDSHPVLDLLADPNPVMTSWALRYMTVASLELTGRAYWWLFRDETGRESVWPLASSWVLPNHTPSLYSSYTVQAPGLGTPFTVPGEDVVHFLYPDPSDPVYGALSPLQALARSVVADEAIQDSQWRAFANGVNPGWLLTVGRHPDTVTGGMGQRPILTIAQRQQVVATIKAFYAGVARAGEPLILDGLIESATRASNTPAEMDFLSSGKVTKERIFLGFGVNAIVAGQVEGANRASSLAADDHFVSTCIGPKIELISECLTGWLAPRYSPDLLLWVEPARSKDPEEEKAEREQRLKYGLITVNEGRAEFGLPPLASGGDELVRPPASGAKGRKRPPRLLVPGRNGT